MASLRETETGVLGLPLARHLAQAQNGDIITVLSGARRGFWRRPGRGRRHVMAEHAETRTPESYERFLALFRSATVGFVAVGVPVSDTSGRVVADGDLGAGRTTYGDGRPRILAYADPEVALRNFGPRFNAGLSGAVLLRMAATDADCDGILVNSATREISLVIDKLTAESLLR